MEDVLFNLKQVYSIAITVTALRCAVFSNKLKGIIEMRLL